MRRRASGAARGSARAGVLGLVTLGNSGGTSARPHLPRNSLPNGHNKRAHSRTDDLLRALSNRRGLVTKPMEPVRRENATGDWPKKNPFVPFSLARARCYSAASFRPPIMPGYSNEPFPRRLQCRFPRCPRTSNKRPLCKRCSCLSPSRRGEQTRNIGNPAGPTRSSCRLLFQSARAVGRQLVALDILICAFLNNAFKHFDPRLAPSRSIGNDQKSTSSYFQSIGRRLVSRPAFYDVVFSFVFMKWRCVLAACIERSPWFLCFCLLAAG